jgi:hypothetical protein
MDRTLDPFVDAPSEVSVWGDVQKQLHSAPDKYVAEQAGIRMSTCTCISPIPAKGLGR